MGQLEVHSNISRKLAFRDCIVVFENKKDLYGCSFKMEFE